MKNIIGRIKRDQNFRKVETDRLLKLINKNIAYTHGGTFHSDDVLCTCLLKYINPDIKIVRINDISELDEETVRNETVLIFDIGGGRYDHHYSGNEKRKYQYNRQFVEYASFGKLWEVLGPVIAGHNYSLLDSEIGASMDLADTVGYHNPLSYLIKSLNPKWNEDQSKENYDKQSYYAVECVLPLLSSYIDSIKALSKAEEMLPEILRNKINIPVKGEKKTISIVYTDTFIPINKYLTYQNIDFYIYKSNREGYCISTIKKSNGKEAKIPIDTQLLLKTKDELNEFISGLYFVHPKGFLACTKTYEAAIAFIVYCYKNYMSP